jgi:flagellar basal-body rod protein FlgB
MALDNIPLFATLKSRLGYLSQREKLVAENVANSDTPGYAPKDLKPFTIPSEKAVGLKLAATTTSARHISSNGGAGAHATTYAAIVAPDGETKLDGNQVVLEEQMMKMQEARMNYDAAIGFYQKSMNLLRMAARAPGR